MAVEVPDDFKELYKQRRRLKDLEIEYEYLKNSEGLGATNYDKVMTSGGTPSDFTDRVVNKLEIKEQLELERRKLSTLIARILCKLDKMKDKKEGCLLKKRYLMDWTWDMVGYYMKEERRKMFKIHESAIESYKLMK